jgi:hypothetical protein
MRAIARPVSAPAAVRNDQEKKGIAQPMPGIRRSSNLEAVHEAWMKQKADEVRAIKEEVRAARDSRDSRGGQKAIRLTEQQSSSNKFTCKTRSDSRVSSHNSPPRDRISSNRTEPNDTKSELKPRWNIPARSPCESERLSPKEVEFLRRREQRGAYLTEDEVERRQQAKIAAIKSSQAAWWERNPSKTKLKVNSLELLSGLGNGRKD